MERCLPHASSKKHAHPLHSCASQCQFHFCPPRSAWRHHWNVTSLLFYFSVSLHALLKDIAPSSPSQPPHGPTGSLIHPVVQPLFPWFHVQFECRNSHMWLLPSLPFPPGMREHPPIPVIDLADHIERLKANDGLRFSQEYEVRAKLYWFLPFQVYKWVSLLLCQRETLFSLFLISYACIVMGYGRLLL